MQNIATPLAIQFVNSRQSLQDMDEALQELNTSPISDKTRVMAADALTKQRQKEAERLQDTERLLKQLREDLA